MLSGCNKNDEESNIQKISEPQNMREQQSDAMVNTAIWPELMNVL